MRFFSPISGDANPEDKTRIVTDAENDLWSIISDILRFFRIGFLLRKELDFEIFLAGEEGDILNARLILLVVAHITKLHRSPSA